MGPSRQTNPYPDPRDPSTYAMLLLHNQEIHMKTKNENQTVQTAEQEPQHNPKCRSYTTKRKLDASSKYKPEQDRTQKYGKTT